MRRICRKDSRLAQTVRRARKETEANTIHQFTRLVRADYSMLCEWHRKRGYWNHRSDIDDLLNAESPARCQQCFAMFRVNDTPPVCTAEYYNCCMAIFPRPTRDRLAHIR